MREMTLSSLINTSKEPFPKYKAEWLAIWVSVNKGVPEIILNPKENFENKLAYYQNAYNEDLTLKANPSIRIIHFEFLSNEQFDLKY